MGSFHQLMDMMRNVSNDGVKRVYSEDSGMGSILDTESLMSVGGPSSSSAGLFNSPRAMPIDMNKEERFSRKVFVGGLPPDIDEGKDRFNLTFREKKEFVYFYRGNHCSFSKIWSIDC
jgi:hypothetical protein